MCDKKNCVLFTDTRCFVLSPDFKLADESQATLDESMLWHGRLGSSSTSQNPQYVLVVTFPRSALLNNYNSSTNEADNTAHEVSATHTQCNSTSRDNRSDAMICAFLASQPNSSQLAREDLEQIDPDDLEEMDLQWEMAMLTIRARRFIQKTGRKLDVNGQRVGFDRTKVECYNCHKYGHFARECRVPRNQENKGRENNRRTVTVETPTENALVAQDELGGYDWSYQAKGRAPTNFALIGVTLQAVLPVQILSPCQFDKFKIGLGYNAVSSTAASHAVESFVNSSEMLENQKNNKSKSDKGYHAVPHICTWNFITSQTLMVLRSRTKTCLGKTDFRPLVIEDWNSDDDSEGNPQQKEYKEKGVIDSGC
ncbi:ribonuclease H-like domain-containing protein [Tanacetum coccineum]